MESLISAFHIDLKLFIAQLINFGLVFSVLYFFAFKPLVKTMSERSERIGKSLKDADEIEKRLSATEIEQKDIISAAKKQANLIVENADKRGEERRTELVDKAKEDISSVMAAERAKMDRDKAETLKEMKAEMADLVVLTVEKLLNEKMTSDKDQELIKKLVK
jgi:F-type H+-transporting ATPase subunit b